MNPQRLATKRLKPGLFRVQKNITIGERKYDGVVYKRRVALTEHEAKDWVHGLKTPDIHHKEPQKTKEIDYFFNMYDGLHPALYLSYEREAYKMRDGGDFRVTFDENIMARDYDISLESDAYGTNLIEDDKVLMELKCSGGLPLWMVDILSVLKVYKRSFSKYGTAYQTMIYPNLEIEAAPGYAAAVRAEASRRSERTADTGDKKRARVYTAGKRQLFSCNCTYIIQGRTHGTKTKLGSRICRLMTSYT